MAPKRRRHGREETHRSQSGSLAALEYVLKYAQVRGSAVPMVKKGQLLLLLLQAGAFEAASAPAEGRQRLRPLPLQPLSSSCVTEKVTFDSSV